MSEPRLLCVGLDAVVLRDVRSCLPDASVHVVRDADDLLQRLALGADLVVLGHAGGLAAIVAAAAPSAPVLAILDPNVGANDVVADAVLTRPVDRRSLQDALRSLVDHPASSDEVLARLRRRLFDPETSWEPRRVFALLRLVVVALVVFDVVGGDVGPSFFDSLAAPATARVLVVVSAATLYGLLRTRWASLSLWATTADGVVWLSLMVGQGDFPSPFLLLLVIAFAQLGHVRRLPALAVAIFLAAGLSTITVMAGGVADLVIVLPLVFLAGGLGIGISVVVRGETVGRRALLEVQASLTGLHDHARRHPGRLEVARVRRDAVVAVRDELGPARVLLLDVGAVDGLAVVDLGIARRDALEIGAMGGHLATTLRTAMVVEDQDLCDLVGGGAVVLGAPLLVGNRSRGLLLAAWDEEWGIRRRGAMCRDLLALANDTALSIDNAELFEAINELGARGERQRLAREIHDGIIQSFVHVGFELERVAREIADIDIPSAMKVIDLRHVVGDAVAETRSIVSHLRDEAAEAGLEAAVRRWLQASPSSLGPPVHFSAGCDFALPPEVVPDLLRVTQEAVANARQHARANLVRVSTRAEGNDFVLVIEDDGRGRSPDRTDANRGVGMRSMSERLARLGGDLAVEQVVPAGTRVVATVPGLLATGAPK